MREDTYRMDWLKNNDRVDIIKHEQGVEINFQCQELKNLGQTGEGKVFGIDLNDAIDKAINGSFEYLSDCLGWLWFDEHYRVQED